MTTVRPAGGSAGPVSLRPTRKLLAATTAAMVAVTGLSLAGLPGGVPAAQAVPPRAAPPQPAPNPDLEKACGIDILLVLDESGSVKNYKADIQRAYRAFTSALKNTGSQLAVAEFSTVARLPLAGAAQTQYTTVTDATIASTFEPYIASGYNPSGSTNWEDGFRMGRYFLPRPSKAQPHLVVFITDGAPNKVIRSSVSPSDYQTKVPLSDSQVTNAGEDAAANQAVPNANAIKDPQGSHILAIAVGDGLSGSANLNRLIKVSGPNVFDGSGTFDISTTDVYKEQDFSKLEAALREAAFQLCSPSVTVRKLVDRTPDPGPDDSVPGAGYQMTAVASPTPKKWVLPANGSGNTATSTTNGEGFVNFQWENERPRSSTVTVTEQSAGPGLVFDPGRTRCTYRTPDQPQDTALPTTSVDRGFTAAVPADAIVTCSMVNVAPAAPGMAIQKFTNGVDADSPPGPELPVGSTVTWTYVVTNTGNTTLSGLAVTDDKVGTITCPATTIAPGAQVTCTATGTAQAGQYANTATATARDSLGTPVGPVRDPSHYFGADPRITVEKSTNGEDADVAPGPFIPVGDPVTWTYVVSNTGNERLTQVAVDDDRVGTVTCPATTLAVGASMTCTATSTAVAGQYANTATASGVGGGRTVTDHDPSHYFGATLSVDLEKLTNGVDADTGTGPLIPVNTTVTWSFVVTNTGNTVLDDIEVVDDREGTIPCPRTTLDPGERMTCTATGTAADGLYTNLGSVTATSPETPGTATDTDPSRYTGVLPGIDIEKLTNGEDADEAPGPILVPGAPVTWTYVVTNIGQVALTDVAVTDDQGVAVTCPATTLAIGATMTCTASGTATAGQYVNLGTVTATSPSGLVGDSDPSHYLGAVPAVQIEKLTNAEDADTAPGPSIPVGGDVLWVYGVQNTGNVPLTNIQVTDDRGVQVRCPRLFLLTPGQIMVCVAVGTATAGQYANIGTVTAASAGGPVTDSDPSHYFGAAPAVDIEKATNGVDADTDPGVPGSDAPYIPVGAPVTWTYTVRNTGNTALENVAVVDDRVGPITCGQSTLAVGASMTCTATGVATAGAYANVGSVTATSVGDGASVEDADPSHYFGSAAAVTLQKTTNGRDADNPRGPRIPAGATVRWDYTVANTGNVPLSSVRVVDDRGVTVTCPQTTIAVGASITCAGSGEAVAGQYANVGTVTAVGPAGTPVQASDPSHYFGVGVPDTGCTGDEQTVTTPNRVRTTPDGLVVIPGETCAGQPVRVVVVCAVPRGLRPSGDRRVCDTTGPRTGPVRVTNRTGASVRVRVTYSAPATDDVRRYREVRTYRMR